MKAILVFLLIPLAMLAHTLFATQLGVYERVPYGAFAVILISLITMGWLLKKKSPLAKGLLALNIVGWLLAGFFVWWTQVYSAYAPMKSVAIGTDVSHVSAHDDFIDDAGNPWSLRLDGDGRTATLLVFYRGHW